MRGPTNIQLKELITQLEGARETALWRVIASSLKKPSRQRCSVNVFKIEKYARDGETIIVPGKVLSVGDLNKKVNVAAFQFSAGAREKILGAQGKVLSISELLQQNPQGKKVRILK